MIPRYLLDVYIDALIEDNLFGMPPGGIFHCQLLKYLHTPEFMGDMINNRLGKGPNTHPLHQHPTKGNDTILQQQKTAKFRGAPTSI